MGYRMVFASIRAVRLFLRARAMIKFALRAASTLTIPDDDQRALRKCNTRSRTNNTIKLITTDNNCMVHSFNSTQIVKISELNLNHDPRQYFV